MPDNIQILKYRQSAIGFLRFLFDAMGSGKLPDFLKSDELKRFIHEMRGGPFGGKLPDGQPGSEIPGTGRELLDFVHEIFDSMGFHPGETDRPDGTNPASGPNDDRVVFARQPNGDTSMETVHPDGSTEIVWHYANGGLGLARISADGMDRHNTVMTPDSRGGGFTVDQWDTVHDGPTTHSRQHYDRNNNPTSSPGEDGGGDTNSGNNPLHNFNILEPASTEHIAKAYEHPEKNDEKLDPNSKTNPLAEADKERLGRITPVLETLDPNSGIDPLTQLNLDPEKMKHIQNEDGKELDPNTGLKQPPHPVKSGG